MKAKILSLILNLLIAGIFFTSCGETKQNSNQLQKDLREKNQQFEDRADDLRTEARQDWENFKVSSEEFLNKRENEIKDLRKRIAKSDKKQRAKLNKELDELERKNKVLKDRISTRTNSLKEDMVEFNGKARENQKAAQLELKNDMDELGKALNNLFTRNTD